MANKREIIQPRTSRALTSRLFRRILPLLAAFHVNNAKAEFPIQLQKPIDHEGNEITYHDAALLERGDWQEVLNRPKAAFDFYAHHADNEVMMRQLNRLYNGLLERNPDRLSRLFEEDGLILILTSAYDQARVNNTEGEMSVIFLDILSRPENMQILLEAIIDSPVRTAEPDLQTREDKLSKLIELHGLLIRLERSRDGLKTEEQQERFRSLRNESRVYSEATYTHVEREILYLIDAYRVLIKRADVQTPRPYEIQVILDDYNSKISNLNELLTAFQENERRFKILPDEPEPEDFNSIINEIQILLNNPNRSYAEEIELKNYKESLDNLMSHGAGYFSIDDRLLDKAIQLQQHLEQLFPSENP